MGWTGIFATHYTRNGRIDRKAECDRLFDERYVVLKSVMVGTVYYAAVLDTQELNVFGETILTKIESGEFLYKPIGEDTGTCDCPASILDLLSATDDEYAIEWRRRCRENIEKKKSPTALRNLAVGSVIACTIGGKEYKLKKMAPNRQFKRCWWHIPDSNKYMPARRIPAEYEVVSA